MKPKINVFLIGVAVAYLNLYIIQKMSPNILTNRVYLTVALVSFSLSITELTKSITKSLRLFRSNHKRLLELLQISYDKRSTITPDEVQICMEGEILRKEINDFSKLSGKNNVLEKVGFFIVDLGYIFSVFLLVVTPFKNISDNIVISKVISEMTLVTFSLMFISVAIDDFFYKKVEDYDYLYKWALINQELIDENAELRHDLLAQQGANDTTGGSQ